YERYLTHTARAIPVISGPSMSARNVSYLSMYAKHRLRLYLLGTRSRSSGREHRHNTVTASLEEN
ncbi:hypothetical protein M378DRAFT_168953, partial [Amanita muscaria Koide BX008]